ncbi:hypothetical protein [Bradyrhizobium sp. 2TAF24]|uniref:hypothetical protein n=1 Tax=Bradyrhizobium sp. 2TAF24 TaxID=3233011 RepID=UPI003F91F023
MVTITGTKSESQSEYFKVGYLLESSADNIIANAGGGQANATQLAAELNRIVTVATAGDSVKLPPSQPGMTIVVTNRGANAMQVFGAGGDTVDDSPAATGVSQMRGSVVIYACHTAGAWYTEGLGTGYTSSGGGAFQTFSYQDGLTASTVHTQAGATPILASQVGFATVANAGDAAVLPPAKAGMQVDVINHGVQNMAVYPAAQAQGGAVGGDQINTLGQNNPLTAVSNTTPAIFYCLTDGQWWTK